LKILAPIVIAFVLIVTLVMACNSQPAAEEPVRQTVQPAPSKETVPVPAEVTASAPVAATPPQTVKTDAQPVVQIQVQETTPVQSNVQEIKKTHYQALVQQPQPPTPSPTAVLGQVTAPTPPARTTAQDIVVQRKETSMRPINVGLEVVSVYTIKNNSKSNCYMGVDLKGEAMNYGVGSDWKVDGIFFTSEWVFKLGPGEQVEFNSLMQTPDLPLTLSFCLLPGTIPFEGRVSKNPSGSDRISIPETPAGQTQATAQPVTQPAGQQIAVERKELSRTGNITAGYSLKNNGSSDCYILPILELDPATLPAGQTIGISFTQYLGDRKYPGPNENYMKLRPGETKVIRWIIDTPEYPAKVNFFNLPQAIPLTNSEVSQGPSGSPRDAIKIKIGNLEKSEDIL